MKVSKNQQIVFQEPEFSSLDVEFKMQPIETKMIDCKKEIKIEVYEPRKGPKPPRGIFG